jgi:hypothetical protein
MHLYAPLQFRSDIQNAIRLEPVRPFTPPPVYADRSVRRNPILFVTPRAIGPGSCAPTKRPKSDYHRPARTPRTDNGVAFVARRDADTDAQVLCKYLPLLASGSPRKRGAIGYAFRGSRIHRRLRHADLPFLGRSFECGLPPVAEPHCRPVHHQLSVVAISSMAKTRAFRSRRA